MQVFKSEPEARKSLHEKPKAYINALCPFDVNGKICGSHCALFYYDKGDDKRASYIILGCKAGTDKKLYV